MGLARIDSRRSDGTVCIWYRPGQSYMLRYVFGKAVTHKNSCSAFLPLKTLSFLGAWRISAFSIPRSCPSCPLWRGCLTSLKRWTVHRKASKRARRRPHFLRRDVSIGRCVTGTGMAHCADLSSTWKDFSSMTEVKSLPLRGFKNVHDKTQ